MENVMTILAQAGETDTNVGAAILGFLLIAGFLWAISAACDRIAAACKRKKSYIVSGRVDEA